MVQEFDPYNSVEACAIDSFAANEEWGRECTVNYTIDFDFDPPIYFHYKLTNFYQNHRSYVKSRSEKQLKNEDVTDNEDCDPSEVKTAQRGPYKGRIMLPCGLIANSFFNDKYKVRYFEKNDETGGYNNPIEFCPSDESTCTGDETNEQWSDKSWYSSPNWDNSNIAWPSDVKKKFASAEQTDRTTDKNTLQHWQNVTLPDTDDQDFIVWMRTSTISTFSKLHRIINEQSLKKGSKLEVTIRNYFSVKSFDGTKSIIITTNSSLGGRSNVLGICFMVIGSLSLLTAVCFRLLLPPKRSPLLDV